MTMYCVPRSTIGLSFLFALAAATSAYAADIKVDLNKQTCQIRIAKEIASGDLAQLKSKLPTGFGPQKAGPTVCLSSPGGDFIEGLKIAEFVADTNISTMLEPGARCVSACSWIFMAGNTWNTAGTALSRSMHPRSYLAFHAPYVDAKRAAIELGSNPPVESVVKFYDQAVSEIGAFVLQLANRRTSLEGEPLLEGSLVTQALVMTGDDRLEINTVARVMRWNIRVADVHGSVPKDRTDVAMACRNALAIARDTWEWDFLYETEVTAYEALYHAASRTLVAHLKLASIRSGACQIKMRFEENSHQLASLEAIANLPRDENLVGLDDLYDVRAHTTLQLPSFGFASPRTLLTDLPLKGAASFNPRHLATIDAPAWCTRQAKKAVDEEEVCKDARLSLFDAALERSFAGLLANASPDQKKALRILQQQWLSRRKACGTAASDDHRIECIARGYLDQIGGLQQFN